MAVLVSAANAVIRKVFNTRRIPGWNCNGIFGAALLGAAAYTLKENEHIRIDIIYGMWSRRTQHWIDLIGHVLFLMPFVTLMVYFLLPWVIRSYVSGEVSTNSGGLILWPAKAMLLIAFVMLFWQGISEIIKKIAIMRGLIEESQPLRLASRGSRVEGAAMVREMEAGLHAGDSREESRK